MQGGCGALTFRSALRPPKTGVNALLERESIGGLRPPYLASEFGFTPASRGRIATLATNSPSLFEMIEDPSDEPANSYPRRMPKLGFGAVAQS
jgi:hypothetical protein